LCTLGLRGFEDLGNAHSAGLDGFKDHANVHSAGLGGRCQQTGEPAQQERDQDPHLQAPPEAENMDSCHRCCTAPMAHGQSSDAARWLLLPDGPAPSSGDGSAVPIPDSDDEELAAAPRPGAPRAAELPELGPLPELEEAKEQRRKKEERRPITQESVLARLPELGASASPSRAAKQAQRRRLPPEEEEATLAASCLASADAWRGNIGHQLGGPLTGTENAHRDMEHIDGALVEVKWRLQLDGGGRDGVGGGCRPGAAATRGSVLAAVLCGAGLRAGGGADGAAARRRHDAEARGGGLADGPVGGGGCGPGFGGPGRARRRGCAACMA
jgi:hypothetical protein